MVNITAVYMHPSANTKEAIGVLYRTISELQTAYAEGIFFVAGDFNQANLKIVLPQLHQHVNFATRGVNTLDMFKAAASNSNTIDADEYAMSVSAYISKCTEGVIIIKNITTRANQKPWIVMISGHF